MKTNIEYIKRHFINRLNKRYLNKEDKEFLILSFEILENHITNKERIKKPNKANFELTYSKFGNPRLIKKD